MAKIFLIGGIGLVGKALQKKLLENGHTITVFNRRRKSTARLPERTFETNLLSPDSLANHDAVINLAGAGIFDKAWTKARKVELIQSRVDLTQNLVQILNQMRETVRPKRLINVSAVGFYGTSWTKSFEEDDPSGEDFLARLCVDWEKAAQAFKGEVCIGRLGIVLSREGGMLKKLGPLFKLFLGGPLDSGKQWISWIHVEDVVNILTYLLTAPPKTYNIVAPQTVRQEAFAKSLGEALGRTSFMPTPAMLLRLILGERAHYLITGQKVIPRALIVQNYAFQHKTLKDALKAIFPK
jgi:uncharacterized protein (TIGR01777 family)